MTKAIIHPNSTGNVSVTIPSGEISLEEVAKKDIPYGVPYKIIDNAELPSDHTFFNAWEADFTNPDGYGLGPNRYFIEQIEIQILELDTLKTEENSSEVDTIIFNLLQERKRFADAILSEEGVTV